MTMENNFDKLQAKMGLAAKNLSQFSKLSERGISEAHEQQLQAATQRKLEVRVTNLTRLLAFLKDQSAKISAIPVVDSSSQRMAIVTSVLRRIEAVRDKKNLPQGASGHLRKVRNELVSIREGVVASVAKDELITHQFPSAIAEVERMLELAKARLDTHKQLESATDASEEAYRRAEKIIEQNAGEVKRLESIKDRPFVVVRVPIVPIADPFINSEKLKKMGVHVEDLAGYPLIHNQMVIGINREILEKKGRKVQKPIEAADEILAMLRKQTGRKLVMVVDKPNPAKGALWYWIAPQEFVNKLMQAAGNRLNIQRWGFGMDSGGFK